MIKNIASRSASLTIHTQIKQGFCYLADMNPPRKSKPGKVRPVVIIQSSDVIQAGSPGVVVLPCTTKIIPENLLRTHLRLIGKHKLVKPSDILIDQIHTIDASLIFDELGELTPRCWAHIVAGIKFLLSFEE